MEFLKKSWKVLLMALVLIAIGILLLVDPTGFTSGAIRLGGAALAALGLYDMIRYFRMEPEEGQKSARCFTGLTLIAAGCFCILRSGWFLDVFPVLAVLYGVFQILLGFRRLQHVVDALRLKMRGWWLLAISAAITLVFGFWITSNPDMSFIGIWTFTGIAMIIEGVVDLVVLLLKDRPAKPAAPAAPAGPADPAGPE